MEKTVSSAIRSFLALTLPQVIRGCRQNSKNSLKKLNDQLKLSSSVLAPLEANKVERSKQFNAKGSRNF